MQIPIALAGYLLLGSAYGSPAALRAPSALTARQNSIPSCDDETKSYAGVYTDGQGTYVESDGVTHPYKFPLVRKCWWDYFVVSEKPENMAWEKSSGEIYCTGTNVCTATSVEGTQTCESSSVSFSAEVSAALEGFGVSAGYTLSQEEQHCSQATDSTACSWTDQACHVVWTQQEVLHQYGYRRHRCDWGDGDETECMGDWERTTPTTKINYGCGSKCTDTNECGNNDGSPCP